MRLWPGGAGDDIFAAVRFGTSGDQRLLPIIQRLRIFFQRVGARQCCDRAGAVDVAQGCVSLAIKGQG